MYACKRFPLFLFCTVIARVPAYDTVQPSTVPPIQVLSCSIMPHANQTAYTTKSNPVLSCATFKVALQPSTDEKFQATTDVVSSISKSSQPVSKFPNPSYKSSSCNSKEAQSRAKPNGELKYGESNYGELSNPTKSSNNTAKAIKAVIALSHLRHSSLRGVTRLRSLAIANRLCQPPVPRSLL